ncbi:uncharacterized protein L3040_008209 [Drepanopeziza brunnea f. sp. 'multigermtubi']|uniref:uncharacterized protein n=1 Tax=Drepanopeziza brunnea f. sp. 'multigermtubi' TaxID=698441 RepID=UPI00239291F7|nr:hypothetical protein L3040_008209 [Drepanopeziza brunnea f. sp. 'multigermtubi']
MSQANRQFPSKKRSSPSKKTNNSQLRALCAFRSASVLDHSKCLLLLPSSSSRSIHDQLIKISARLVVDRWLPRPVSCPVGDLSNCFLCVFLLGSAVRG